MITLLRAGLLVVVLLSGCGWNGAPTRHNDITPLTAIKIVASVPAIETSRKIAVNTSTKLTVIGDYSGLFTKDITDQAVWSSGTPAVVDFSTDAGNKNRVIGKSAGTSVIGASVGTFVAPPYTLTVSSATATTVAVTPATVSVAKGLSAQLSATGTFSDSTTQDLTFDAVWTTSAAAVATVGDTVSTKGLVQAVATGPATITATFDTKSGTAALTVTAPILKSIAIDQSNPSTLNVSTYNFKATGIFSDNSTADVTSQATWESSLTGIATIGTNSGIAATIAPGTTVIKATKDGFSGSTNLKVTGGNLTSIALALDKFTPQGGVVTMVKDTTARVIATGTFSNGTTRDITGAVGITVTDTTANVAKPGGNLAWLTATAVTTAPLTVSGSFSPLTTVAAGSIKVTVIAPTLQSFVVSPSSISSLAVNASQRLTATATYSDGTVQDVTANTTWTTGAVATASVGTVDLAKGQVVGVAAGSTFVTANYGILTQTVPVTVVTRTVSSIAITPVSSTVTSGSQRAFTATATFSDNTTADITEKAVWVSDKTSVAALADNVNQPGQIVAVESGTANLSATFGGKSATVTITVP
jgi:hypothetical protein